ncbi:hypothetical protein B0H16DRAFT_1723597 [Mycena metata]|uniref:Uncharacterized protein n=1 Tax=Mycena metata TaxID=1033252 RepID=A0AAD7J0U7_9AGAR|nr:hypothetical protein B0H16DRAFT_1723597 [Mycena metata]
MSNTEISTLPVLNDMRYPYTHPQWPTTIRSLAELQAYLEHPDSDALGSAVYGIDFVDSKGDSYERCASTYLQFDGHTPFTFTLFGQVGRIEADRRVIVVGVPDGCPEELKHLFGDQMQALMAPVLHDDFDAENIRAEICTDASRETGTGGHYIELCLGRTAIMHTANGTKVIAASDDIPLHIDDWVLVKATYHKEVDSMGDMRRYYEAWAWHIRTLFVEQDDELYTPAGPSLLVKRETTDVDLPVVGIPATQDSATEATQDVLTTSDSTETLASVETPKRKKNPKRSAPTSTSRSRKRAKGGSESPLNGPRTRGATKAAMANEGSGTMSRKRR